MSPAYLNAFEQIMGAMPKGAFSLKKRNIFQYLKSEINLLYSVIIGSAEISDWGSIITPIIKL